MPRSDIPNAGIAVLAAAVLAGCGDGGGMTGRPVPGPGSYNLQAAMKTLLNTGLSVNVRLSGTATANGASTPFTGTGTLSLSPGASGTFNGAAALLQTQMISGTVTIAGQSSPFSASVTNAFDSAGTAFLGQSQSSEVDVAPAPITIPTAVGTTTMLLGTVSRYTDNTLSAVLGTTQISVFEKNIPTDPGSPEIIQFTYTAYDTQQALVQTDTVSYSLSPDSVLTFYGATSQNGSGTLTVNGP